MVPLSASAASQYLSRMWEMRYFLGSLVSLDLKTRYRHSFLGIGWSLIRPVAMSVVFCVIFCRLFKLEVAEYAPFVLTGITVWQFLVEASLLGCTSFGQAAAYIKQKPLPLALFPLRTVLGCGIHGGISLMLALAVAWLFNCSFNVFAFLALFPSIALVFMVALFMAILFGMMQAHFPDTRHLLEIGFQIVFYVTPVMYYPSLLRAKNHGAWLVELNPFAHVLDLVRLPIWKGEIAPWTSYAWAAGFCLLVGLLAVWCLKKLERTLVFWV